MRYVFSFPLIHLLSQQQQWQQRWWWWWIEKNGIMKWNVGENNNWIIIFGVIYLPIAFILLLQHVFLLLIHYHAHVGPYFFAQFTAYLLLPCNGTERPSQFFVRWRQRLLSTTELKFFRCCPRMFICCLLLLVPLLFWWHRVHIWHTHIRWLHPRNIFHNTDHLI